MTKVKVKNNCIIKVLSIWSQIHGKNYAIFVTTRCHILRLKCIKFKCGWGSVPDPTRGAYNVFPNSLAGSKKPTFNKREENGKGKIY